MDAEERLREKFPAFDWRIEEPGYGGLVHVHIFKPDDPETRRLYGVIKRAALEEKLEAVGKLLAKKYLTRRPCDVAL